MFDSVVSQFMALAGFAAFIAIFVNILKFFNVIKEESVSTWVTGLNLVGILTMYGFRIFRPEFDFSSLNPVMQEIATVATFIFAFVSQLLASKFAHEAVRGTPVIGKSYSLDRERELNGLTSK